MSVLTLVVFGVFFLGFYSGSRRGVIRSLRGCVSFMAGMLFARPLSLFLSDLAGPAIRKFLKGSLVDGMLGEPGNALTSLLGNVAMQASDYYMNRLTQAVCLMVSFLLIGLVCEFVLDLLWRAEQAPVVNSIGRILGGMIGLLRSGICIWIVQIILASLSIFGLSQATTVLAYFEKEPILSSIFAVNPLKILLRL